MASVTDREIPALLASVGVTDQVQWSEADQENWVYYDKKVTWTDASGTQQTCTAKRVMWWVGPQAVLARIGSSRARGAAALIGQTQRPALLATAVKAHEQVMTAPRFWR